jgi:hypothetical protein
MLMIPSISDILGKMKILVDQSFDLLSADAVLRGFFGGGEKGLGGVELLLDFALQSDDVRGGDQTRPLEIVLNEPHEPPGMRHQNGDLVRDRQASLISRGSRIRSSCACSARSSEAHSAAPRESARQELRTARPLA